MISNGDTVHFECRIDVHHTVGEIVSVHERDMRDGGKGSVPAVNAHNSTIVSGLSGVSDNSN